MVTKNGKPVDNAYHLAEAEKLAQNMGKVAELTAGLFSAIARPESVKSLESQVGDNIAEGVRTFGKVAEAWLTDPQRLMQAQVGFWKSQMDLWHATFRRAMGEHVRPVAEPPRGDRRFSDDEWSENAVFDFLKQSYLLSAAWAERMVEDADGLDPHTRHKASFYTRQLANALSPTNFFLTNPQVLRETLSSNGENLVRGLENLRRDFERGQGELKVSQTDLSAFAVGENMALTPGKVVFQNPICQLIQYEPTTDEVVKTPLVIVPPWINKFYILDLNPEKSFIHWAVSQGHTVFVISWVNPDEKLAEKSFEDYMLQGILECIAAVQEETGEPKVNIIGYCVGGTLLSATLAYLAAIGENPIASATFFTTQVDFTEAGDLMVFVDEDQINAVERKMETKGYLEGSGMARAFNLLRSNDLIWSYVVNNYLMGKDPFPFDLLYWNSDSTRMPAANHSFYLRECYLDNRLASGQMTLAGKTLDLGKVKVPIYNLATKEDHIAPARSVFNGGRMFGGTTRFVLAGSGHIAGVVNPPDKKKYQHWVGGKGDTFEAWLDTAKEHEGSWWPDWHSWVTRRSKAKVKARKPGAGALGTIEDAPGSYVKVRAD